MPEPKSFARQHADNKGFTAVPRWWWRSEFRKSLPIEHRGVLDELYDKIARFPLVLEDTGITVKRGQWAISLDTLARASGASIRQVRTATGKAVAAGIISVTTVRAKRTRSTHPFSLFTWVDFDLYDDARRVGDTSADKSTDKSSDTSADKSSDICNTQPQKPNPEIPKVRQKINHRADDDFSPSGFESQFDIDLPVKGTPAYRLIHKRKFPARLVRTLYCEAGHPDPLTGDGGDIAEAIANYLDAHEIENPVGYVKGILKNIETSRESLLANGSSRVVAGGDADESDPKKRVYAEWREMGLNLQ